MPKKCEWKMWKTCWENSTFSNRLYFMMDSATQAGKVYWSNSVLVTLGIRKDLSFSFTQLHRGIMGSLLLAVVNGRLQH